jgi:hypothetical protein
MYFSRLEKMKIYKISKMASVFINSKTINQTLSPRRAARHNATPFQGIVHAAAKIRVNIRYLSMVFFIFIITILLYHIP